ncbi:hypothetical protein Tco_0271910, partial [Tanacetum coccineum]
IMSSATSAVTYTSVYTDSEPGRAFWGADDEEISEGGIPRVIVLGYDGLPMQPVAPPSSDYIPGPEDPQTPLVLQDEDDRELSEEQPLHPVDSPTAESPRFVTKSDPEEDPEEYEDDEIEYGPDEDDKDEEGEEEEHLTLANSAIDIPVDEPVFPPEGTEPTIPPPSTDITIGARITVQPQTSISLPLEAEVERLLAMTTPSPSPPISQSPPSVGERLSRCTSPPAHSSPLPMLSPLLPSSGCPTQIQTLRIASTQALIDVVTAALPSPPPLPPSLYIPQLVDSRDDIPESEQPPHYQFVSTVDAEERRQRIRDVGYDIRDTWVDPAEAVPEIAPMTVGEVNTRVTKLAELHEHDTHDLYALLEDAQDSRSRISQRVDMDSQRVDLLIGDMMTLQETVWMVEEEAYASREAWAHSIGLSQYPIRSFRPNPWDMCSHTDHLRHINTATTCRRQAQMVETLQVIRDMRREMSDMQDELLALREQQRRARQPRPDARSPDHQDASGDADSHI